MGVLAVKLVYSVFSAMCIFCCSSMQLVHPLTMKLQANETDMMALLAIKAQIQHDPNQVTSSWNDSIHFCSWYGVTCSQRHQQRVSKLNLSSQGLAGSISPHIGNLSFLRGICLYNNTFTHEIPPEIGSLHRLQVLLLHNNSFTGHIPPNVSNCFNLTFLSLGRNKLVGEIPSQLGFLSKLQILVLQGNYLTGEIPSSLGNLS
ncbi:putative non-specific serine/threonine protein kinase [Rosa chinensis]|uniref:Putative non-specific serine/threonine protein kinase n=1 Tax=Rosa chinensis TaxID=74649 RepID=A0A2P6SHE7_ROSCH|nr:putative non-specific serine/threonine protein kinase [Rosa chinensis]